MRTKNRIRRQITQCVLSDRQSKFHFFTYYPNQMIKRIVRFPIVFLSAVLLLYINPLQAHIQDGAAAPGSSEATSSARNVNIPVDLSTGRANVQIPLFTVGTPNIQIPVSLNYQTSGIKVTDVATWVGLGWNLSAVGKITRIVRGHPDDQGYLLLSMQTNLQNIIKNQSSWNHGLFDSYYDQQSNGNLDGQPDIFYFEIPGKSGMFVLDPAGKAHTIPYQDIQVRKERSFDFTIIDENGTKYLFAYSGREAIEQTIIDTTVDNSITLPSFIKPDVKTKTVGYRSGWQLYQITDCHGEVVSFTYDNTSSFEYENYNYAALFDINTTTKEKVKKYEYLQHIKTKEKPAYLKEITWRGGKLEFISTTDRKDLQGARLLKEIKLYSSGNRYLKSIILNYSIFSNLSPQLFSLYEQSGYNKKSICSFTYNTSVKMPARDKAGFDHWGYYNGTTAKLRQLPACNVENIQIDGVSRTPNFTYAKASILEAIVFPNGGKRELVYELNQGSPYYGNTRIDAGGLRIKQIKEYNPSTSESRITNYEYVTEYNQPSGTLLFDKPRYFEVAAVEVQNGERHLWTTIFGNSGNCLSDASGNTTFYTSVKVTMPDSSYSLTKFNPSRDECGYRAVVPDGGPISSRFEQEMNGFILNTSNAWKRVPIETASYTATRELISRQTNEYVEVAGHKTTLDAYVLFALGGQDPTRGRFLGRYQYVSCPYRLARTHNYPSKYSLESETRYIYGDNPLRPIETITYTAEKDTIRNRVKYSSDFFSQLTEYTGSDPMLVALKKMQSKGMTAIPIETVTEKNGKILSAQLRTFRTIPSLNDAVVSHTIKKMYLQKPISSSSFTFSGITGNQFRFDSRYEDEQIMDQYDEYLNLIQSHDAYGNNRAVIYGYEGTLPIASVDNAKISTDKTVLASQIFHTSFEDDGTDIGSCVTGEKVHQGEYAFDYTGFISGTYTLTYWIKDNINSSWRLVSEDLLIRDIRPIPPVRRIGSSSSYIDELRVYPKNTRMSTCTYLPGVGKLSETDYNNRTSYMEYDAFGRLIETQDNDRNKRTSYTYYE